MQVRTPAGSPCVDVGDNGPLRSAEVRDDTQEV